MTADVTAPVVAAPAHERTFAEFALSAGTL